MDCIHLTFLDSEDLPRLTNSLIEDFATVYLLYNPAHLVIIIVILGNKVFS